jgi:hypothetical protein
MPTPASSVEAAVTSSQEESDRRKFVRYALATPPRIRCLVQPGFRFDDALLKDISVSGFCLILKHALPVDARLIVQLPGRRRGISLSRAARVLRVEADGEGRWLVGCELSSLLSDEEITALRAGCETASGK